MKYQKYFKESFWYDQEGEKFMEISRILDDDLCKDGKSFPIKEIVGVKRQKEKEI